MSELQWINAEELCVEGQGWTDTKAFFDRLPARAEGKVREEVWNLSRHTTGITLRFETNATSIHARWTLGEGALSRPHTPLYASSGLDLYARTPAGQWHWVGVARDITGVEAETSLSNWGDLDGKWHEFCAYLPLFNSVKKLTIGIPEGAEIRAMAPRSEKSIAYYGTSIVHGAGVSRPGMTHVAMLGRRLDYPIMNLGFSGNAVMEPEVATFLAELDPAAYIVDSLPNMSANLVTERALNFIRCLRAAHPITPMVLVEDRTYPAAWLTPSMASENVTRRKAFKKVYSELLQEKGGDLYYIEGDGLLGTDNDGTNDGSHTNDLGASRMADALEPVLRRVLGLAGC